MGTPKWLANKMRAKGLQKLKWYCQMCEKQCRDENGFKVTKILLSVTDCLKGIKGKCKFFAPMPIDSWIVFLKHLSTHLCN